MANKLRFFIERSFVQNGFKLSICDRSFTTQGRIAVCEPWVFKQVEEHALTSDPSCADFDLESAQQLMDELWKCGIRPHEIGTPGHLKALERHLSDMRQIAMHQLGLASKVIDKDKEKP